jgi:hypothetical protein
MNEVDDTPADDEEERRQRAAELREELEELKRGSTDEHGRPRPPTPREFTEPDRARDDADANE